MSIDVKLGRFRTPMFQSRLDPLFREAVAAIDAGNAAALNQLLRAHPDLVRERLTRPGEWLKKQAGPSLKGFFKHPFLFWFVAEDPVRHGTLPANIVEVTQVIIDALAREQVPTRQEQLDYTLRLVAWSGVAADRNVQIPLIDALVDAGARPAGEADNALVNGHVEAARHLIARGGTLSLATALGIDRWDEVPRLFAAASGADRRMAFVLAALNGRAEALRRMIALGVDVNAPSENLYSHGTPLHHAVCSGSLEAVQVLVEAGADVNTRDTAWKGTPMGWANHYIDETTAVKNDARLALYRAIAGYLDARGSRDD